jgi:hypothetical protein
VKPDRIDDIKAQVIACDIAKQVEEELTHGPDPHHRGARVPVYRIRPPVSPEKHIKPFYPNGRGCLLSTTSERESAEFQTPWFHLPRGISLPVIHGNASKLAV